MARKHKGYILVQVNDLVDVPADDIIEALSDDQLREAAVERFGGSLLADFDLLADIEEALLRHKPLDALSIIENHRTMLRVSEGTRAKQLAEMRMAGAA